MGVRIFHSASAEDTFSLGEKCGSICHPGDIILLNGELGVGKTVFSKGFGKGLGIQEPISSPTFTLIQIYEDGRLPLYHFDVYRIADIWEMDEIGYEDCFFGNGVCLIEWAERIEELLPEKKISITIEKDLEKGFHYRKITIEGLDTEAEDENIRN